MMRAPLLPVLLWAAVAAQASDKCDNDDLADGVRRQLAHAPSACCCPVPAPLMRGTAADCSQTVCLTRLTPAGSVSVSCRAAQASPGKFSPSQGQFLLKDSDGSFHHWLFGIDAGPGPGPGGGVSGVAGDWSGTGWSGVGVHVASTGTFHLRSNLTAGPPDVSFQFGPASPTAPDDVLPIAGDWLGTGRASVGVWVRSTGAVLLRPSTDPADTRKSISYQFGPPGKSWWPIAGDWTGAGFASVGLFDPQSSTFYLRTENAAGPADLTIQCLLQGINLPFKSASIYPCLWVYLWRICSPVGTVLRVWAPSRWQVLRGVLSSFRLKMLNNVQFLIWVHI